ncbi:hypothetical protein JTE90_021076 [Oedothorax gibbosus]|uniref:Enkurin domain-containing protein n=1 Tax=Oedothorax gibbosus TaxID=931172 RepID=A0AAV6VQW9_9ARAC|nr:hypothetical protein JTE90_021076 [Oedothorax gibbosus]
MPKASDEEKPLSYRSKFASVTREEFNSMKSNIPRTMGYMQTPLRPPQSYLKKHSREDKTDHNKPVTCLCRNRNPKEYSKIPKASSALADPPKKNYILENIQNSTNRPCTAPTPKKIDSRKGHAFELEESGWVPKYTNKEGLVKNLKQLLKRYLKLPVHVDTPFKIKQKEDIERRMDALQRDIDLIRENRDILIARERPSTAFY